MSRYLDYPDADESDDYEIRDVPSKTPDMNITSRVHVILRHAEMLHEIEDTLRQVNMDRLANKIAGVRKTIIDIAEPISSMAMTDLQKNINHNGYMLGGLLEIALREAGKINQG